MDVQYSEVRTRSGATPDMAAHPAHPEGDAAYALLKRATARVIGPDLPIQVLQLSPRGGLALFQRGERRFVFKLMSCGAAWRKRLLRCIGWNPARRAFRQSVTILAAGIPACEVLEHGTIRLPGAPRAVYMISEFYADGITLRAYKRELQPHRRSAEHPEIVRLCGAAVSLLRRLHDAGFQHLDFHAGNLLVTASAAEGRLRLLDLDTVVRRRPFVASRARELCRFTQNFVEPQNYREVIDQMLRDYAAGDEGLLNLLRRSRPVAKLTARRGVQKKDVTRAAEAAAANACPTEFAA